MNGCVPTDEHMRACECRVVALSCTGPRLWVLVQSLLWQRPQFGGPLLDFGMPAGGTGRRRLTVTLRLR
jgi:hypothetical protein